MCDSHWEALRLGPERARCDGKQVGGLWAHADLNGLLRFLARRVLRRFRVTGANAWHMVAHSCRRFLGRNAG